MSETANATSANCRYCGMLHPGPMCPFVRAIEYHPDGTVRRVEFAGPSSAAEVTPYSREHRYPSWGLTANHRAKT